MCILSRKMDPIMVTDERKGGSEGSEVMSLPIKVDWIVCSSLDFKQM